MDQAEKLGDKNHERKEQSSVRLRPSPSMSLKINPNYTVYLYLYLIDKGAPLPSHLVPTNSGPSSHQLRVPFSGDRFIGKVMNLN